MSRLFLYEGKLTLKEYQTALNDTARGKTPMVDGLLAAKFFQSFWPLLGADLVEVLKICYDCGRLFPPQNSGLITLLYE